MRARAARRRASGESELTLPSCLGSGSAAPLQVLEAREFLDEGEADGAGGPVALLPDDELRDAAVLVGGFVLFLPEDEDDDVRVLLEPAAFTKIAELRALLGARFRRAR